MYVYFHYRKKAKTLWHLEKIDRFRKCEMRLILLVILPTPVIIHN